MYAAWLSPAVLCTGLLSGCPADEQPPGSDAISCPAAHVLEGNTLPGEGTNHPEVTGSETWKAADSPHFVGDNMIGLQNGTVLTIEPCAVVVMKAGAALSVGDFTNGSPGDLVAVGTAESPILFAGATPEAGSWSAIHLELTGGQSRFSYVTFDGGGSDANLHSTLHASVIGTPTPLLDIDHCTIRNGLRDGIVLEEQAEFSARSEANTITGVAGFPIQADPLAVGTVPEGSYTGNGDDRIVIRGWNATAGDGVHPATWKKLSIPYLYDLGTYQNWNVALTVEAGVHVSVKNDLSQPATGGNGSLWFVEGGSITADGVDEAGKIVFDAEGGVPWGGFRFVRAQNPGETDAGQSTFNFVKLDGAGSIGSCTTSDMCTDILECQTAVALEGPFLAMTNSEIVGAGPTMYAITREYCGEGGEGLAAPALGNVFRGPMNCPQSDQNECITPAEACDPATSCCQHDYVCFGEVL